MPNVRRINSHYNSNTMPSVKYNLSKHRFTPSDTSLFRTRIVIRKGIILEGRVFINETLVQVVLN